jgi:hypothetical protein
MSEHRSYLIPTWLLVIVFFGSGLPTLFNLWLWRTTGLSDDSSFRWSQITTMFVFALPAWFALGMMIQRWIRRPPPPEGQGWHYDP